MVIWQPKPQVRSRSGMAESRRSMGSPLHGPRGAAGRGDILCTGPACRGHGRRPACRACRPIATFCRSMTELAKLTWPEARAAFGPDLVAFLPLGSTEPHGPHLP